MVRVGACCTAVCCRGSVAPPVDGDAESTGPIPMPRRRLRPRYTQPRQSTQNTHDHWRLHCRRSLQAGQRCQYLASRLASFCSGACSSVLLLHSFVQRAHLHWAVALDVYPYAVLRINTCHPVKRMSGSIDGTCSLSYPRRPFLHERPGNDCDGLALS